MAERKSWREIDRQRDHSESRPSREERRSVHSSETAKANYLQQLNAFFDRGIVPEHLKDKLPTTGEVPERQKCLRALREAKDTKSQCAALDDLLKLGAMPDDPEVWLVALEHPKADVQLQAISLIEARLNEGRALPRKALIRSRLQGLEFTSFDPRVQTKAPLLAAKLA